MKIGFAADLHFERGGDAGVTQYQKSFGEMIAGMIQRGINVAVFGGDIFNRWHSFNPRTFRIVADGLEQLIRQGIRVYMLAGNHDYDISGTFPAIMPFEKLGVEIVIRPHSEVVSNTSTEKMGPFFNDVNESALFTFLPWVTKGMAKEAGIDLKQSTETINDEIFKHFVIPILESERNKQGKYKTSCLFFHASIFGADMGSMRCIEAVDFTLYPDLIAEYGYTHVVGGHFHRRQEHKGIIYVGSMERQNFGEKDNPTGWLLLDGSNREFVELKSPLRYTEISFDFTQDGDFDALMARINAEKATDNASLKLKYKIRRNEPFDRARVLKALYDAGAASVVLEPEYIEEVQSRTEIKAEQDFLTQFEIWRAANPDKDPNGEMLALLDRERMVGFPAETTNEMIDSIMNGGVS